MSIYGRDFDKTKCIYFLIKDEIFFGKYNEFSEKVSNIIKKEFNKEFIYHKQNLKDEKEVNTKEDFHCICKWVILINSVYKKQWKLLS